MAIGSKATYKRPAGMNEKGVIAHFLDWKAQQDPFEFIDIDELHEVVRDTKLSDELDVRRRWMSTIRGAGDKLLKLYQRLLYSNPNRLEPGFRASVDDSDKLVNDLPKRLSRLESAKKSAEASLDRIDIAKVPVTDETKPFIAKYEQARDVMKLVDGKFKELAAPAVPAV